MTMPALYSLLRKAKSAVVSFLLVAPLMLLALSAASMAPQGAWAQERQSQQSTLMMAASDFRARLKVLERQAALFKPDGTPVRAKVRTSVKGDSKPIPQAREHILLGRQISAHKKAIGKLRARVDAFGKEARGHEMGHNLDMPAPSASGAAAKKKRTTRSKESGKVRFGDGKRGARTPPALDAKSKSLERDIRALEKKARAIYKRPGRLK